jgi:hypothetical protein
MFFKSSRVHLASSPPAAVPRWMKAALIFGLIGLGAVGYVIIATNSLTLAQDATQATADDPDSKPKSEQAKPADTSTKHPRRVALRKAKPQQAAPQPQLAAWPTAQTASQNFAARLQQAGATTCARRIDELAVASLQGATATANVSSWFVAAPNERPVNVVIAQKFAAANVPYGATDIFASPEPNAKCDAFSVQVVPSPLSCERLRQIISSHGRVVADLVGIPFLQDSNGQIMLVPTPANACVLIGLRMAYTP